MKNESRFHRRIKSVGLNMALEVNNSELDVPVNVKMAACRVGSACVRM